MTRLRNDSMGFNGIPFGVWGFGGEKRQPLSYERGCSHSEAVILECCGQSVFVAAHDLLNRRFGHDLFQIRLCVFGTSWAAGDIYHRPPEFPAGGAELFSVVFGQFLAAGKRTPGFGFLVRQGVVNGVVPQVIYIPVFATGGTMNIHANLLYAFSNAVMVSLISSSVSVQPAYGRPATTADLKS